ncbi:MAG TPA: 3D domain-containing protein [Polyangiaceae bacterium]|nr:3D domain-containing protein [Polyangiaceae bacterium]
MKRSLGWFALGSLALVLGCASGTRWVNEAPGPSNGGDQPVRLYDEHAKAPGSQADDSRPRTIGGDRSGPLKETELADAPGQRPQLTLSSSGSSASSSSADAPPADAPPDARLVGVFRNTYYDFPAESDFSGAKTALMSPSCQPLRQVPRGFFEAVCVQGSGTLTSGATVSFAKRDCACAEVCPRTGQKICFDELDQKTFPWGRGATGKAITPLKTVAVDSNVIPLGTRIYIAEFDGVPRGPGGSPHDGCFIAEDRGMKVVGEHVDVFTGNPRVTAFLNGKVPSNRGVHVYTGTARCQ